jgi:hypothetical protein
MPRSRCALRKRTALLDDRSNVTARGYNRADDGTRMYAMSNAASPICRFQMAR